LDEQKQIAIKYEKKCYIPFIAPVEVVPSKCSYLSFSSWIPLARAITRNTLLAIETSPFKKPEKLVKVSPLPSRDSL
jgi:hypothetical protein